MSIDNDALSALRVQRATLNLIRSLEPRAALCDIATVAVTDDAIDRLQTIASDLPSGAVGFPTFDQWPWGSRPVIFVHSPIELLYDLSTVNHCPRDESSVQPESTIAHIVFPPGTLPIQLFNPGHEHLSADDIRTMEEATRVIAVHPDAVTTRWVGDTVNERLHDETATSFLAALARAPMTHSLLCHGMRLSRCARRNVERAGTTIESLDVPRIGDTRNGSLPTATGLNRRAHFSQYGEPKKALTQEQANWILAITSERGLHSYTCPVCGEIHLGHTPRRFERVCADQLTAAPSQGTSR